MWNENDYKKNEQIVFDCILDVSLEIAYVYAKIISQKFSKKEQNNSTGEKFGDSSDATSPTDKLCVYPSLIAFYHEWG